jgi:glycosyltransferase involved in cell wall biosynthesis
VSVIVCAHNEAAHLPGCLHSLLAQTRLPDEILVVNNASTDATRAVAEQVPGVRVVDEPRKGLVVARETGRHETTGDILVYLDADCRAPLTWIERIARHFDRDAGLIALSARYRFYDWDWWGRTLIRAYDFVVAPLTQLLVKHVLGMEPSSTAATSPFAATRWTESAASIPRSNFMARIRTRPASVSDRRRCPPLRLLSCTPPRAATSSWERPLCSDYMCAISSPSCCTIVPRTPHTWM